MSPHLSPYHDGDRNVHGGHPFFPRGGVDREGRDERCVSFAQEDMNECDSDSQGRASIITSSAGEPLEDPTRSGGLRGGSRDGIPLLCGDDPDSLLFEAFHSDSDEDEDGMALDEDIFSQMVNSVDFDCLKASPSSTYSDSSVMSGKPYVDEDDLPHAIDRESVGSIDVFDNLDVLHVPTPRVPLTTTFTSIAGERPLHFRAVSPQIAASHLTLPVTKPSYTSAFATPQQCSLASGHESTGIGGQGGGGKGAFATISPNRDAADSSGGRFVRDDSSGVCKKTTRAHHAMKANFSSTLPPHGLNSCGSVCEMESSYYQGDSDFSSGSDSDEEDDDEEGLLKSSLSYDELTTSPLLIHSPRALRFKKLAQVAATAAAAKANGLFAALSPGKGASKTKGKGGGNKAIKMVTGGGKDVRLLELTGRKGYSNEEMLRMCDRTRSPKSPPGGGHFNYDGELDNARTAAAGKGDKRDRHNDRPLKK
jgi:hypothetical protein